MRTSNYFAVPGFIRNMTPEFIIDKVASTFSMEPKMVLSSSKAANIKHARWFVWKVLRSYGYTEIKCARATNNTDHTTVYKGLKKLDGDISSDLELKSKWDKVKYYMNPHPLDRPLKTSCSRKKAA